ncbi:hypothetical protein F5B22DRAFT_386046 [Xylaria bambusicola]|uniref:uncharacterized protein n=1 Tax=Xylaria bambusicola TaxID=326684 RepID=UPI00200775B9|nr:uncharacterized protein F5B22DRAFT_386046 [Xylaria bambusicola]KAI0508629.1 hypothetical protein F5B22DRAFT_386046 [Xylaria bambusicola]
MALSVASFFPQLAGLTSDSPNSRPVALGGQSFTHCCLLAVNESLVYSDGNLSYASPSFIDPRVSIESLQNAVQNDAFPCGAEFTGDKSGAPVVSVTYNWCADKCPGWEISHFNVLQQWVGPLVQFIVPCLAFCTNVPRTRKLGIPDIVFRAHPRTVIGLATYWVRLLGALLLMLLDTVVWLSICFAFAGPMLLSAVYEYALDRKVLEFLSPPKGHPPNIPMRLRAQLLLAVVCGNIRMAMRERSDSDSAEDGTRADAENGLGYSESDKMPETTHRVVHNSIWKRIMTMVDEYEAIRLDPDGSGKEVVSLPTKLKSLLNSQASFGSTVGASILFFVGGFIYTVIDSESSLSDNDTAHALAFGMWWMVIPYLAIIACAMLAANSPSTLDGIVYDGANTAVPDKYEMSFLRSRIQKAKTYKPIAMIFRLLEGYNPVELAFEGRFRTVKLWKRGLNKRQWVQEAVNDYEASMTMHRLGKSIGPVKLRRQLTLNAQDCAYVVVSSLFLVLAPTALAFLLSYHTPRAGLSCRSLVYLVYAISQVCEMILWSLAARLRVKYGNRWSVTVPIAKRFCWYGQVFVGGFAIFAAVGGTLLQLLGVFRNCLCSVPATYWPYLNGPEAYFAISTNSQEAIVVAEAWWTTTGSTSVGLISIITALAWWHQRRLRKMFKEQADQLENDEIY